MKQEKMMLGYNQAGREHAGKVLGNGLIMVISFVMTIISLGIMLINFWIGVIIGIISLCVCVKTSEKNVKLGKE